MRGVILDVDGTLIDSNDAHAAAYVSAFADERLEVPFDRVRRLIGMGSEKLLSAVGVDPGSHVAQRVQRRKKEHFANEHLAGLRPCRGARDLLEAMKKHGLRRFVATSAATDELHDLLRAADVEPLIETRRLRATQRRRSPTRISWRRQSLVAALLAMRSQCSATRRTTSRLQGAQAFPPSRCVRGGWSDRDLAAAVAIYDDPADLLEHFASSLFSSRHRG